MRISSAITLATNEPIITGAPHEFVTYLIRCHENVTVVHSSLVLSDVCKHSFVLDILLYSIM